MNFELLPDPRTGASAAELQEQFDFIWSINRKLTETHQAIERLRRLLEQIAAVEARIAGDARYEELEQSAEQLQQRLTGIEETLYQTRMESRQDPLNFPIRLNDKLAGVMQAAAYGDHRPTASAIAVRDELTAAIDAELEALRTVTGPELEAFNALIDRHELPAVEVVNRP